MWGWTRKHQNNLENVARGVPNNMSRSNGNKCAETALKLLGTGRNCSNCGAEWGAVAIDAWQL